MLKEKEQFIANIDNRVNKILSKGGGDEKLLMSLSGFMNGGLKNIVESTSHDELDKFCQKYSGFYRLIKLLEGLAQGISGGRISVP